MRTEGIAPKDRATTEGGHTPRAETFTAPVAAARALDRPGSAAKSGYIIGRGAWVLLALVNTVAIMHFWYDGFVRSVLKHQVVQA